MPGSLPKNRHRRHAALLAAPLALALALPGWAQTAPAGAPAEPVAETAEPVTEAMVLELRENGLIARQAEISEGLLLMDRQLRQAQLAQQLLALYGPETPVEIAPGQFRDFSGTPLGLREQIARLKLELELLEAAGEVQRAREETRGAGAIASAFAALRPAAPAPGSSAPAGTDPTGTTDPAAEVAVETRPPETDIDITVRELRGGGGRYAALLRVNGEDLLVRDGDRLDSGIREIGRAHV